MESSATSPSVDLGAQRSRSGLALLLALLSVPGSLLTWDALPGGGFVFGVPLAVAALVLGLQARRRAQAGRGKALAAILVASLMLATVFVWTIVESL